MLKNFGGKKQVFKKTSEGRRFIDVLDPNSVAHESKVGYTTATDFVKKQIRKDAELISSGDIEGARWHFFTSGVTGKVGPSQPLIDYLQEYNIPITIHTGGK